MTRRDLASKPSPRGHSLPRNIGSRDWTSSEVPVHGDRDPKEGHNLSHPLGTHRGDMSESEFSVDPVSATLRSYRLAKSAPYRDPVVPWSRHRYDLEDADGLGDLDDNLYRDIEGMFGGEEGWANGQEDTLQSPTGGATMLCDQHPESKVNRRSKKPQPSQSQPQPSREAQERRLPAKRPVTTDPNGDREPRTTTGGKGRPIPPRHPSPGSRGQHASRSTRSLMTRWQGLTGSHTTAQAPV